MEISLLILLKNEERYLSKCDGTKNSIMLWEEDLTREQKRLEDKQISLDTFKMREKIIYERIAIDNEYLKETEKNLANVRKEIKKYLLEHILVD